MHMQGSPATMQHQPQYGNVLEEVKAFLSERAEAALDAGISPEHIMLDPGIGFGKRREDNLALIAGLREFAELGYPLLLGTSRKRFMGSLCDESEPTELLGATCATTALGVAAGVRVFRVHDVQPNRQAAVVAWSIARYQN
jgi:dihydropteroate synthase